MFLVADSSHEKNMRIRLPGELSKHWKHLLTTKKISQQDAIEALVQFVIKQDDVSQSMILQQVSASNDLIEIVLKKIAAKRRAKVDYPLGDDEGNAVGEEQDQSRSPGHRGKQAKKS